MKILIKVVIIIGLVLVLLATLPTLLTPITDFLGIAFDSTIIDLMNNLFDILPSDIKAIFRMLLAVAITAFVVDLVVNK